MKCSPEGAQFIESEASWARSAPSSPGSSPVLKIAGRPSSKIKIDGILSVMEMILNSHQSTFTAFNSVY